MNETSSSRDWNLSVGIVGADMGSTSERGQESGDRSQVEQKTGKRAAHVAPSVRSSLITSNARNHLPPQSSGTSASQSRSVTSRTSPFSSATVNAPGFSGIGTAEYSSRSHSATR